MIDVRDVVESWFIMLKEDIFVLIRIESLVALVTLLFLVMFIMDIFRYQGRSSAINKLIETVDNVSDLIVVYLLGAMQSTYFYNPMFPVWAIVLVSLRGSLGYLSGYGVVNRGQRIAEFATVIQFSSAGVLNGMRGSPIAGPLWSLWSILQLRSLYKFFAHGRAVESLWHARSSEFLPEYLDRKHVGEANYLVYGEDKQKIHVKKPEYVVHLDVTHQDSLITLDKIRQCSGSLLRSKSAYADMGLAFSLSRLLRCHLEDVPLNKESTSSTRHLITSEVIGGGTDTEAAASRAFRILELELAFVRDYFNTLYPVVFWRGLSSLSLSLVQSMATIVVAFWLAVDIRKLYSFLPEQPIDGDGLPLPDTDRNLVLQVGGCNVDVVTAWVVMFFMMFKEVWEMVTYLLSNWTRLLLVCKYVRSQRWCLGSAHLREGLTGSFFTSKIADPWHGRIGQYDFLQSCTYKPTFGKLAHSATLGKTPEKFDGIKYGNAIKIPECVRTAVFQELRRSDLTSRQLPRDTLSLGNPSIDCKRYDWAWSRLRTCSQVILVWHIATSLCEVRLAKDNGFVSNPGSLRSVWSHLKNPCRYCSSPQPFLVDEGISQEGGLQTNYRIANNLSRYCAYLLVFQSELLPDTFLVPDLIFGATIKQACEILECCESRQCRYTALMAIAQDAAQDTEEGRLSKDIVQQGALLAKDLINENEQDRWEILAGVWTKLLVHVAPSWNAEAHKFNLASGGEFITLIWALLYHCGIEKSNLWHDDKASGGNDHAAQEPSTESTNTHHRGTASS